MKGMISAFRMKSRNPSSARIHTAPATAPATPPNTAPAAISPAVTAAIRNARMGSPRRGADTGPAVIRHRRPSELVPQG